MGYSPDFLNNSPRPKDRGNIAGYDRNNKSQKEFRK